jgi:hypothetical protein
MSPWCGPRTDAPPDLAAEGAGFVGMMGAVGTGACGLEALFGGDMAVVVVPGDARMYPADLTT